MILLISTEYSILLDLSSLFRLAGRHDESKDLRYYLIIIGVVILYLLIKAAIKSAINDVKIKKEKEKEKHNEPK